MISIISDILLTIAILTTAVIYGTDIFHALVMRKATALSKDDSIIDLVGHTHLIADKRMPAIGITSVICTSVSIILNLTHAWSAGLLSGALLMLLFHLYLYMTIAKPINTIMSDAAVKNFVPDNTRALQNRWESAINYRAAFLMAAMLMLVIAAVFTA
ncbi:MAG: DUF1772 domain-containing protein [Sphingobacteriales bacterium]|nr:MAG: DUF1772 domain-containing protein [Sphingobacteriales bacterium]